MAFVFTTTTAEATATMPMTDHMISNFNTISNNMAICNKLFFST